jgi:UPF0042 nucleotide-binding protein
METLGGARFVFLTGLSGSGKTLALKALEDSDFFCVDNLPASLLLPFAELIAKGGENIDRVAIVADIRERGFLGRFPDALQRLRKRGFPTMLVFLEAREDVLVRRFSESRRPHPLQSGGGSLVEAVREEQQELGPIRAIADRTVNTSDLTVHELRKLVLENCVETDAVSGPVLHVLSFGYKYGVPPGADLVFDVRFLPNPYFESALREKSGNDPEVEAFLMAHESTPELLERLDGFLSYLLPHYRSEGKSNLTIAVGCTGGQHRSVVIANYLCRRLRDSNHRTQVSHRDVEEESEH